MIRISKWSGLVTAASPYILPAGGAVEQINACGFYPGQLSVRGGTRAVLTDGGEGPYGSVGNDALIELWGYSPGSGASDKLFAFTDQGDLHVLDAPEV